MFKNKAVLIICFFVLTCFTVFANTFIFPKIYAKDNNKTVPIQRTIKSKGNVKKVIGISVMNNINEYWNDLTDGVKTYCKSAGYDVINVQVNDSVEEQVKSINNFINQGVDGIIVAAINETALEASIQKAMDRGIKVIAHLHDLKEFNLLYGPKEYEMGFMAGRYMGKLLKDNGITHPKLAMLTDPDVATLIDREKGMEDGLREFVPETIIIAKEPGYRPDLGKSAAIKIIKENHTFNGFIGINDNGLLGAQEASQELGLANKKDFFIVGIGGDRVTLDAIKRNTPFRATVNIDPWLNGYTEAKYMQDMFEGREYLNQVVYFSPLSIIDRSNVNEVIAEKERRRKLLEK